MTSGALRHPQNEEYWGNVNPDGIRSCYDEGKHAAETLCFDYNRIYGTKIKVIRIFNAFGLKMTPEDGRVISSSVNQALRGWKPQTPVNAEFRKVVECCWELMEPKSS